MPGYGSAPASTLLTQQDVTSVANPYNRPVPQGPPVGRFGNFLQNVSQGASDGLTFGLPNMGEPEKPMPWVQTLALLAATLAEPGPDLPLAGLLNKLPEGVLRQALTAEVPKAYHGTSKAFDTFDSAFNDPDALYGPGFYFTEDPKIASGYAHKGTGDAPNIRVASLKFNKVFDVDDVLEYDSPDVQHILQVAEQSRPDLDWDYARELLEQREESYNLIGRDVFTTLSKIWDVNGTAAKRAAASDILKAAGYDGITHMGGKEGGKHRVWIAFDKGQIGDAIP
jgi:hypothetical protein